MPKYSIIYADPPWTYDNPKDNDPKMGGKTYATMTQAEIENMNVQEIAAPDCALFLWATMPKLREALSVITAWGFTYTTCAFVWVKLNPKGALVPIGKHLILERGVYSGLGHWTNGNAELCLFAKVGRPKRLTRNVKQIVLAPRGRHSAKPPEVRDRIVALMGDLPRIELFARETVARWDAWGRGVPGFALTHPIISRAVNAALQRDPNPPPLDPSIRIYQVNDVDWLATDKSKEETRQWYLTNPWEHDEDEVWPLHEWQDTDPEKVHLRDLLDPEEGECTLHESILEHFANNGTLPCLVSTTES